MSASEVVYEVNDSTAVITIDRPQKLNALNRETLERLDASVRRGEADAKAQAIIITGAGPKSFVAGADISELAQQTPIGGRQMSRHGQAVLDRIERLRKPVVAAINGFALGGGLELALACHLRVAAENAFLGLPELSLGIIPGYGGTQRLARLVGRGRALEMILTARKIGATEAERIGLVNRVVPEGQARDGAQALVAEILANGPLAVEYALRAVAEGLDAPLAEGQSLEAALFGLICASEDTREGLQAFLDKRRPAFTGR